MRWVYGLLQLKGHEKVLEIGTGSGYQAAVLSPLVKEVHTIEIIKITQIYRIRSEVRVQISPPRSNIHDHWSKVY